MNAHPVAPEDVMAFVDGQVSAAEARDIKTHLAGCDSCRQLADELRSGSEEIRQWTVDEPPPSLVAPRSRDHRKNSKLVWLSWGAQTWSRVTRQPLLAGAAVVALIVTASVLPTPEPARLASAPASVEKPETIFDFPQPQTGTQGLAGTRANAAPQMAPEPVESGPRIVRTATLRMVAGDFDRIRPAVDRILQNIGGFAGALTASDRPGAPRSIRGTLRIPSTRFAAALAELRALGRVTEESQNTEDVTATVADLDARLSNARVTEKRLTEVLQNRTGGVADVLEVEREIARVRTEIEQMEAQRKQLESRIEYATLTLEIVEERVASVNLGPVPIPARLRYAIADGVASATKSMLDVTLLLLRAGPALLLWAMVLGLPVWWMLRRRSA